MALKRKRASLGSKTTKDVRKAKGKINDPKVHPLETTLADLPHDIINIILLKLPIKSLLICKCVCKSWRTMISDPNFAQLYVECAPVIALVRTRELIHLSGTLYLRRASRTLHLLDFDEFKGNEAPNLQSRSHVCLCQDYPDPNCEYHMKLEPKFTLPLIDSKMSLDTKGTINLVHKPKDEQFEELNSCNGLLCMWGHIQRNSQVISNPETLVVCNPITGEFMILPQSENDRTMTGCNVYFGFGYLKKTNEYKVIRIYSRRGIDHDYDDGVVEIHTLGTKLWRNIKYHGPWWRRIKYPTYLNGSLHWLVYNIIKVSILCFDLESETSNLIPCPPEISSLQNLDTKSRVGFGELKGSLWICCPLANAKRIQFWTMKKYGDSQSWLGVFIINLEKIYCGPHLDQLIVGFSGPGILIYDPSRFFCYYDPQKGLIKFFEGRGTSLELKPIFHIPTLIRLKDIVKGHNIEVFNVYSRCPTFKLQEDKNVLYMAKHKADMKTTFRNF